MDATAHALEQLILVLLLPLWMLAGLADWACHLAQRIEHSSGLKESWLHLAMLAEIGTGIVAGLALEPTAAFLVLLWLLCIAHELTTWWDLGHASRCRVIPPYEQWVHAVQLALPWGALVAMLVAHRDQTLAVVGWGNAVARWEFTPRDSPLPLAVWLAVAAGATLFGILPLLQENARCRRAQAGLATIR